MAKFQEKILARKYRSGGMSILNISRALGISKSTASIWCRDIKLTPAQINKLHNDMVRGSYAGSLKGAETNKLRRLELVEKYRQVGVGEFINLSRRDLMMLGIGLFMGEGSKTGSSVRFLNSNVDIIKIFIRWTIEVLGVPRSNVICRVMINEMHRHRDAEIRSRWSSSLEIPVSQFQKTVFIKVRNKKVYENYNDYLGTLAVSLRKSSVIQYRILGLIHGLVYKINAKSLAG